ncbi:ABC transporter ATP-binding protein [Chromobacterium sp. CV08]|uniref:ABC transporter ATP-binding protein n=1 Tax=Chromobacterium sp. CV08 TaxID=3133274 RepID=UPI003DA98567
MIIDVQNLTVRLPSADGPKTVIRDISFQLERGEVLGVVGESGCGKSVTNLALMGLLPRGADVEASRLRLCGHDLLTLRKRDWPAIRGRRATMIFQNPMSALNPSLTIGSQLAETLRRTEPGLDKRGLARRGAELLEQVGIASPGARLASYPHQLSGGMAQRAMIAMALACRPDLLIADEPTTALDVTIQRQILDLLLEARRQRGMSILLVSHDIGVIGEYTDRIQVMYSGEIVETGSAAMLTGLPAHPYTQGLLAARPTHALPPKTVLPTIPGTVPPIGQAIAGCRFSSRCPRAEAGCAQPPALKPRAGHDAATYRCHL